VLTPGDGNPPTVVYGDCDPEARWYRELEPEAY
jgi:hypothetical protein